MFQNKKLPTGSLLVAGLAAFAWYKYNKMSVEEREKLFGDLKEKGQELCEKYMPEQLKSVFNKSGNTSNNTGSQFDESNNYTG